MSKFNTHIHTHAISKALHNTQRSQLKSNSHQHAESLHHHHRLAAQVYCRPSLQRLLSRPCARLPTIRRPGRTAQQGIRELHQEGAGAAERARGQRQAQRAGPGEGRREADLARGRRVGKAAQPRRTPVRRAPAAGEGHRSQGARPPPLLIPLQLLSIDPIYFINPYT